MESTYAKQQRLPLGDAAIWRAISHSLDLAVISYCGAHLEGFDQRYLGHQFQSLSIFSTIFRDFGPCPTLQRRTLKCLDGFLEGEQVWVLHTHGPPPNPLASQPLYLRTTIEAFADIWGPVWKSNPINQPKRVTRSMQVLASLYLGWGWWILSRHHYLGRSTVIGLQMMMLLLLRMRHSPISHIKCTLLAKLHLLSQTTPTVPY